MKGRMKLYAERESGHGLSFNLFTPANGLDSKALPALQQKWQSSGAFQSLQMLAAENWRPSLTCLKKDPIFLLGLAYDSKHIDLKVSCECQTTS